MSIRTPPEPPLSRPTSRQDPSGTQLPPWLRHAIRTILHFLLDGAAVASAYDGAYWLRFRWDFWLSRFPIPGIEPEWWIYQRMLYAVVPIWLMIFWYSSRLYHNPWMSAADRFLQILKGCVLGTAIEPGILEDAATLVPVVPGHAAAALAAKGVGASVDLLLDGLECCVGLRPLRHRDRVPRVSDGPMHGRHESGCGAKQSEAHVRTPTARQSTRRSR